MLLIFLEVVLNLLIPSGGLEVEGANYSQEGVGFCFGHGRQQVQRLLWQRLTIAD
jgi:hypothetical protein